MLHFEGERDYSATPAELFAKLSDARFLVQSIPGAESVKEAEADRAVCTIRPGFAFVRGTLEVTLRILERVADKTVKVALHSKGVGSTSEVETRLNLEPADGGTKLRWDADLTQLGGLLKMVPKGLIRGAAQKVIGEVLDNVQARLADSK
jgi:2-furoyl-CoA dehydrogenase large subunit